MTMMYRVVSHLPELEVCIGILPCMSVTTMSHGYGEVCLSASAHSPCFMHDGTFSAWMITKDAESLLIIIYAYNKYMALE